MNSNKNRENVAEIMSHPWLASFDWAALRKKVSRE